MISLVQGHSALAEIWRKNNFPLKVSPHRWREFFVRCALDDHQLQSHLLASRLASGVTAMEPPTRLKRSSEKKGPATEILEKDDVELRLEKALFGDDAGFLESLTKREVGNTRGLIRRTSNGSAESDQDNEEGDRLSDVPDEDVCIL